MMTNNRGAEYGAVSPILLAVIFACITLLGGLSMPIPDRCPCDFYATWNGTGWESYVCKNITCTGSNCYLEDYGAGTGVFFCECNDASDPDICACFGEGTIIETVIVSVQCKANAAGCSLQKKCKRTDQSPGWNPVAGTQYRFCDCY